LSHFQGAGNGPTADFIVRNHIMVDASQTQMALRVNLRVAKASERNELGLGCACKNGREHMLPAVENVVPL
jgi:hypothetical protein